MQKMALRRIEEASRHKHFFKHFFSALEGNEVGYGNGKLRGIVLREQARGESNKQIVLLAQGVGRVLLSPVVPGRAKK